MSVTALIAAAQRSVFRPQAPRLATALLFAAAPLAGCDVAVAPAADAGAAMSFGDDASVATDAGNLTDAADADDSGSVVRDAQSHAECVPSCAARICGDDGCGGACGACEDGAVCLADGEACGCDGAVTYRLSAPEVDWRRTERLIVAYRQAFPASADSRAPWTRWSTVELTDAHRTRELTIEGACAPELDIVRVYVTTARDALGRTLVCESEVERIAGRTDIELPAGTGRPCAL